MQGGKIMITVLHKLFFEDSAGQPSSNQRLANMALAPMASTPRRLPPLWHTVAAPGFACENTCTEHEFTIFS